MPRERKRYTVEELEKVITSGAKKYVRYEEGAKLYSMGRNTFIDLARQANAVYKFKGVALVNVKKVDEYMEYMLQEY